MHIYFFQIYPDDDVHVSVNMRGGPERFTITGWLQIKDVQKHHEGFFLYKQFIPINLIYIIKQIAWRFSK